VKEVDTDTIQASAVMPQVGTELYALAVEKGYLRMKNWADYAMQGEQTAVMEYPDLSQAEMNAGVNRLLKEFYFQPHVIARLLRQSWRRPALLSSYWTGFVMCCAISARARIWLKRNRIPRNDLLLVAFVLDGCRRTGASFQPSR
jgi:hypothetical protein